MDCRKPRSDFSHCGNGECSSFRATVSTTSPQDGPLDFDDGTDTGHPRGNTQREGGTWQVEDTDTGDLKPPAEILSPRNGPSDRKHGR